MAGKPCFFQRRIGIATPMLLQFYRPCEIRKKITLLFSLPFDRGKARAASNKRLAGSKGKRVREGHEGREL
jgi:hypothetical protein